MDVESGSLIIYDSPDGGAKVEVIFGGEDAFLTQRTMADLFGVDVRTINDHLKNIFSSGELNETATIRKYRIVQNEGGRQVKRWVTFYNLDGIISVGYRVNSSKATQFRIWATKTLKEFMVKGYVLDTEKLKNGTRFGKDYFNELLEKIREIRASERYFYQKLTDLYAQGSVDYDSTSETTHNFFSTVQNKLHFAITGFTAAEIIKNRADANKEHMGLTTWKASPNGKILKSDVTIAKNYLSVEEVEQLNRIVSMYLDFAELRASRQIVMTMNDWIAKLNAFLSFNDYDILHDLGKVSAAVASELAESEYEKFRKIQDHNYFSDFDKTIQSKLNETNEKS